MQHLLSEDSTLKTVKLTCEENTLIVETTTGGKSKSTSKIFPGPAEAEKEFFKKEWDLLKKGAVMRASDAVAGTPLMHMYTGGGYTGCLSFVSTPHGIYVYQAGGSGREMGTQDNLLCIAHDGRVMSALTLPGLLPWDICYDTRQDQLLIDLDHYIYQYDFTTASFTKLTHELKMPASFATLGTDTRAYATHPHYYIKKGTSGPPKEMELDVTIIKGSIPLCACLSPDGEVLALHNSEGEVKLIDTVSNNVVAILQSDFGRAEQLIWTKDGKQVMVHSRYGTTPLRFFDRTTGKETIYESLAIPSYSKDISDCCINADNTLLVCLQRTNAFVFDFKMKTFLYSFPIHHCIKTGQVKFIDNNTLGMRTDYGSFSIYQL